MAKIKALFFDIDDTLYDSSKLAKLARKNSIKAMIDAGLPEKDEVKVFEILKKVIKKFGSNYPHHYDELIKEMGESWDPKIIASGVVAYEHIKVVYLKPFPNVVPILLEIKKNYKLGVISNGLAIKQWEKLVGLGVHHLFNIVVTSEEEGFEKPDQQIFTHAVKKMGLKPEECIMVGDRLDNDIVGAKKSGMLTILIKNDNEGKMSTDGEKPDFIINEFSELIEILNDLG